MLAVTHHYSIGDWIIGGAAIVIVVGLFVFLVVFLVRRFAPQAPHRSLERVEAAVSEEPPNPGALAWKRTLHARIPLWIAYPMMVVLGPFLAVLYPFGRDWQAYGSVLAVAVLFGFWTKRRVHSRVIYRAKGESVTWTWIGPPKEDSARPPVIVQPSPSPTETPSA